MTTTEQFSLRWNNFHSNLTSGFHELLESAEMVDVTLAVEGHFLQAHKIVLSICSPYFRQMFKENPCKHPIVILNDVRHHNMKDILEFMYMGQVNVLRENLSNFLRTAELLQVKGLTGDDSQSDTSSRKDDRDDDSDMLQYSQLMDSDVELPPFHPLSQQWISTLNQTKRQKNSHNSKSKRSKSDNQTPNQNNKTASVKTEQDVNNATNNSNNIKASDDSEYLETSFQMDNNKTGDGLLDETKEDIRQLLENSSSNNNPIDPGRPDVVKCNNSNNRVMYQCEKCAKRFSRRDHLRTHEKNIHGEDAGPFLCILCSQLYKNTESLRKHIAKFHFPKITELDTKVEVKA